MVKNTASKVKILRDMAVLIIVVLAIGAAVLLYNHHKAEQIQIARKNFEDATNPRSETNFRVEDVITVIQENSEADMTNSDWMDNEMQTHEESSAIVDRDIQFLKKRTAQQIAECLETTDFSPDRQRQVTNQISAWESGMEQKILQTAIEAKKHAATAKDVEDAIVLTFQLKQANQ